MQAGAGQVMYGCLDLFIRHGQRHSRRAGARHLQRDRQAVGDLVGLVVVEEEADPGHEEARYPICMKLPSCGRRRETSFAGALSLHHLVAGGPARSGTDAPTMSASAKAHTPAQSTARRILQNTAWLLGGKGFGQGRR